VVISPSGVIGSHLWSFVLRMSFVVICLAALFVVICLTASLVVICAAGVIGGYCFILQGLG